MYLLLVWDSNIFSIVCDFNCIYYWYERSNIISIDMGSIVWTFKHNMYWNGLLSVFSISVDLQMYLILVEAFDCILFWYELTHVLTISVSYQIYLAMVRDFRCISYWCGFLNAHLFNTSRVFGKSLSPYKGCLNDLDQF